MSFDQINITLAVVVAVLIPTLVFFALDHLRDIFPVSGQSVKVGRKTTSVCRSYDYPMGHAYNIEL